MQITTGAYMTRYSVLLGAVAMTVAACNPFHQAVRVTSKDQTLNSRWHANLASPASLAGAVQMSGSASMAPNPDASQTNISIDLANASPGGRHPWSVQQGQCGSGADYGVFGTNESYKPLEVTSGGAASGEATISMPVPSSGSYFVVVRASSANWATIVACGNLAPPTR
jgi:hypothetical protein